MRGSNSQCLRLTTEMISCLSSIEWKATWTQLTRSLEHDGVLGVEPGKPWDERQDLLSLTLGNIIRSSHKTRSIFRDLGHNKISFINQNGVWRPSHLYKITDGRKSVWFDTNKKIPFDEFWWKRLTKIWWTQTKGTLTLAPWTTHPTTHTETWSEPCRRCQT